MQGIKRYTTLILLTIILAIGTILRFYKISQVPNGLEQDETSLGYNSYSILKTGKDEYGKKFPVYFQAFGEYKLPGYIYGSVIPIKLFGLNEFGVRFLSAATGTLTILLIFLITQELWRGEKRDVCALAAALALALAPWHIHFSRGAFEVVPALFWLVLGLWTYLAALNTKKGWLLFISVIAFFASVYTYNISRLLVFLLVPTLLAIYHTEFGALRRHWKLGSLGLFLLLASVFAVGLIKSPGTSATKGTLIFSSNAVQAPLLEFRSIINLKSPLIAKVFFNRVGLTLWQYLVNLTNYLSVEFFFTQGSTHGNHGIGTIGQFFIFELPLLIWGVIETWKNQKAAKVLGILTLLTVMIAALTREAPQATRSFNLLLPLSLLIGAGTITAINWLKSQARLTQYATGVLVFILVGYSLAHYFASYFWRFPVVYAKNWNSEDKAVSQFVAKQTDYQRIVFDTRTEFPYTSLLFYTQTDPTSFIKSSVRATPDTEGFSPVKQFGRYAFRSLDWDKEAKDKSVTTLYVTSEKFLPADPNLKKQLQIVATFNYPDEPVVLSQGEIMYTFTQQANAFLVVRFQ